MNQKEWHRNPDTWMKFVVLFVGVFLVVTLLGCASTDIIQNQRKLYTPPEFSAGSPMDAYRAASKAAKAAYIEAISAEQGNAVAAMIDAGIAEVNHNCRIWFSRVAQADLRWEQGQGELNVIQNAIGAILGAAKAPYDLITAYGIASTGLAAYNANFAASVLGVGDYDLQTKLKEIMSSREAAIRSQAGAYSYPQALDAIEEYAALCSPQAAKAAARSSLTSTRTYATPAGSLQSVVRPPQ